jgi:hypothetical protein
MAVWCAILAVGLGCGAEAAPTNSPSAYANSVFISADEKYQAHPEDVQTAWEFSRACFDWAEFASNNTQRAELANLGMTAARTALKRDSNSVAAHYYLGKNLGQLARTKSLGALPLVDQMEASFKRAMALDERFDHAGPDRFLGRLYFEAPAIASIGSRSNARFHFTRAAELDPDYPENRLNLIEAGIRWKETEAARRELEALEQQLDEARAHFSGEEWAAAWSDWNQRLEAARAALRKPTSKPTRAGKGASLFN